MNIAVTGHTQGLGKAFLDYYSSQGHQVIGFSRQTGYDLRDWSSMQRVLDHTKDFDLVISNAKPDFFQTVFLYAMAKRLCHASRIISIGSCIIDNEVGQDQDIGINLYKTQKKALQDAHRQIIKKYKDFDSVLVHPYHLYDVDNIDYIELNNWIVRMEQSIKNNENEVYVK
jgi:NAD(P)-dependent dehydrogenase (short-subunit alcohol dehydrogenase family)